MSPHGRCIRLEGVFIMSVAVALIIIFCVRAPFGRSFAFGSNPLHDGIEGKGNSDDRRVNGG